MSINCNSNSNNTPTLTLIHIGDLFRLEANHLCDETNHCRMWPNRVDGQTIFIKGDLYGWFVASVMPRMNGTYILVSHNGDASTPDGQTDARALDHRARH